MWFVLHNIYRPGKKDEPAILANHHKNGACVKFFDTEEKAYKYFYDWFVSTECWVDQSDPDPFEEIFGPGYIKLPKSLEIDLCKRLYQIFINSGFSENVDARVGKVVATD